MVWALGKPPSPIASVGSDYVVKIMAAPVITIKQVQILSICPFLLLYRYCRLHGLCALVMSCVSHALLLIQPDLVPLRQKRRCQILFILLFYNTCLVVKAGVGFQGLLGSPSSTSRLVCSSDKLGSTCSSNATRAAPARGMLSQFAEEQGSTSRELPIHDS